MHASDSDALRCAALRIDSIAGPAAKGLKPDPIASHRPVLFIVCVGVSTDQPAAEKHNPDKKLEAKTR